MEGYNIDCCGVMNKIIKCTKSLFDNDFVNSVQEL